MTQPPKDAVDITNILQECLPFPAEVLAGEKEVGIDASWIVIQLPSGAQYQITVNEIDDENRFGPDIDDPS
jgi:hypothetical protein